MSKVRVNAHLQMVELADFPDSPGPGQLCFVGGIQYIWSELGSLTTWWPMNSPRSTYVHTQGLAATEWTVNHGLKTKDVIVVVYDMNHEVQYAHVQNTTTDTSLITLSEAITGYAVVFGVQDISVPTVTAENIVVSSELTVAGNSVITTGDGIDLGEL